MLKMDKPWYRELALLTYEYSDKKRPIPESKLMYVLRDPDSLISEVFEIPEGLMERVVFWGKVFGVYNSGQAIIHDRDNLSVMYDVVSLSELQSRRRKIELILRNISRAGSIERFKPANEYEERIARLVSENMSRSEYLNAYRNMRSQTCLSDVTRRGVELSSRYMPIIESMFREKDLPWELTRLPFVESSFDITAVSRLGARGIWQIMDAVGVHFMETDPVYDERHSPFKASAVAAKLLKDNYRILKSWPLAITAYNHGPSGLRRAIRQVGSTDISRIVSEYKDPRFGFASKNFYAEFLAALYVTVYADVLFDKIQRSQVMSIAYVIMEEELRIDEISRISGLKNEDIIYYNPEFSPKIASGILPVSSGVTIKLPPRASYRMVDYFIRRSDEILIEQRRRTRGELDVSELD